MPTQYLTTRQVAELIHRSEYTVRQMGRRREIKGIQAGPRGRWLFTLRAVEAWAKRNETTS